MWEKKKVIIILHLQTFTINKEVVEVKSEVFCSLSMCELDVYAPIIITRD